MNKIINSAWFGNSLTNIQRLSIQSYIANGHEFHLYVNAPVDRIPAGVILRDAGEIVSRERLAQFTHNSQAADLFRLLLINRVGGWWVDADTVCLKPFDFPEDYAFVSEVQLGMRLDPRVHKTQKPVSTVVKPYLSNSTFKAPAEAPILKYMIDEINSTDVSTPEDWIAFGPTLFRETVPKFGLQKYVKPPVIFDGMNYDEIFMFVSEGINWSISPESYALHLRTSCWLGPEFKCPPYGGDIPVYLDPNGKYPEDSLFEQLKRRYGV